MKPVNWYDFQGKYKVIFAFQDWCPGCHRNGFPDLKQMVEALNDKIITTTNLSCAKQLSTEIHTYLYT